MTLVFIAGISLALSVVIVGLLLERRDTVVKARLARYAQPTVTLEEMELRLPMSERLFLPIVQRISTLLYRMTPGSQITLTRQNLAMAGLASGMSVAQFQVRRLLVAIGLGGSLALYGTMAGMPMTSLLTLALPLGTLGYLLPSMWLGGRVRERQAAIQRTLPDAIDMLTVCVEAGSGFDSALARVVDKWKGPLSDEFERLLADLRMGRVRREALKDLADRTGIVDVQSFVTALIQADLLGVGLVKVLRVQADQMRQRRRLRAEEMAQKAPIKMLFPLVFLIFPAVYIVILGPAAIQLSTVFGG